MRKTARQKSSMFKFILNAPIECFTIP